jgi:hypothetical protein
LNRSTFLINIPTHHQKPPKDSTHPHPHKCANTRKPRSTAAATHAPSPSSQNTATTHKQPTFNARTQTHHKSSPTPSAGPACKHRLARSSFAIIYLASLWSRRPRSWRLAEVARIGLMLIGVSARRGWRRRMLLGSRDECLPAFGFVQSCLGAGV